MNRKYSVIPFLLALAVLLAVPLPAAAAGGESARIEVILVEASNSGSGVDQSLNRYAGTLKRLFKFDSYRQISRNSLRVDLPGEAAGGLGNGTRLAIKASPADNRTLRTDLNWTRGGKTLLHTRLNLSRSTPAVLGGPRTQSGNGNYLLLVIWN